MQVLHEQNLSESKQLKYMKVDRAESSRTQQNFQSLDEHENNGSRARPAFWSWKNKQLKVLIALIVVVGLLGTVWYQDFRTTSDKPINRQGQQQDKTIEQKHQQPAPQPKKEEEHVQTQQQKMKKECYKVQHLRNHVFFVNMQKEELTPQQVAKFEKFNSVCQFQVLYENAFDYYIDLWNMREQQQRYDQDYINKTLLTKDEKKQLLIWLKLYFSPSIYIHMSLGVNYGKYINDRYLLNAQVGKELLFAKVDHQNNKGIYVPQRNFKTVKVGQGLSQFVHKIIKKTLNKQDWMEMCEHQQCIIINNAIKYPQGL